MEIERLEFGGIVWSSGRIGKEMGRQRVVIVMTLTAEELDGEPQETVSRSCSAVIAAMVRECAPA
jgi:hypothetical protein